MRQSVPLFRRKRHGTTRSTVTEAAGRGEELANDQRYKLMSSSNITAARRLEPQLRQTRPETEKRVKKGSL